VLRRVSRPALAAHVVVEARVSVGDDVETGELLLVDEDGQRVDVLITFPAVAFSMDVPSSIRDVV
jgi:hypothetical protein